MLSGRPPVHLGDESGFTLIELLVAMVTGIIVTGALFAILEVSMHQTARVTDVTQANQLGRSTMTHIVDELHSACIAAEQKPIQVGSGASKLVFVDAYSEKAEIPSAHKDEIIWEEATGKMIDKTYLSTAGSWPKFTFSGTATPSAGVIIGEKISQAEQGGKKLPIFQYFAYTTKPSTSPTAPSTTLSEEPLKVPFEKEEQAALAASVLISFKAAPTSNVTSRAIELSNQVTFAFSAPAAESPVEGAPCE